MTVFEWAQRHGVSHEAVVELLAILEPERPTGQPGPETSEAAVQAAVAIDAAKHGGALWRNNSGAFQDPTGAWVRYGLANTSKKINKRFKSSDLIGITPRLVTESMVGSVVGIFTAAEIKEPGWKGPRPSNEREQAQANFLKFVRGVGGIGKFVQSVKDMYP